MRSDRSLPGVEGRSVLWRLRGLNPTADRLATRGESPMTGDVSPAEIRFDFAAFDGWK